MQATKIRVNAAYTFLKEYGPRFEVIMGGAGSGKSYGVAQHIILAALDPKNSARNYLCVRKVARTLRHSIYNLLKHIIYELDLGSEFRFNSTDMSITSKSGQQIILMGLDDVEKLKSIYGITDVWIEEATECTPDDVKQLNLRLRGGDVKKRIILTFNPISSTHWLKAYFFDTVRDSAHITCTTHWDNAFIDEVYRAELLSLKETDPYYYQVYAMGEWGVLGNVVFTNYVIEDFNYTDNDLENVSTGMDFGYAHASALVRIGFRDGELYVFDEVWGKGWTNPDFINAVHDQFGDDAKYWDIIADSAEPDRIDEWNRAGYHVLGAKKGKNSLAYGIDWLTHQKMHIHILKCPNLIKEIQSYKRREDNNGVALDSFVELNDDAIAAMRYASEWIWDQSPGTVATSYGAYDLGL